MRRKFFKWMIAVLAFFAISANSSQICADGKGDILITIAKYIQKGDSDKLSIWFADNLEIYLLGEQISCSKTQGKHILKDFFSMHPPKKFTILQKSGSHNMRYAIGTLVCANGDGFRVILLTRAMQSTSQIVRIRIEKE